MIFFLLWPLIIAFFSFQNSRTSFQSGLTALKCCLSSSLFLAFIFLASYCWLLETALITMHVTYNNNFHQSEALVLRILEWWDLTPCLSSRHRTSRLILFVCWRLSKIFFAVYNDNNAFFHSILRYFLVKAIFFLRQLVDFVTNVSRRLRFRLLEPTITFEWFNIMNTPSYDCVCLNLHHQDFYFLLAETLAPVGGP